MKAILARMLLKLRYYVDFVWRRLRGRPSREEEERAKWQVRVARQRVVVAALNVRTAEEEVKLAKLQRKAKAQINAGLSID